MKLVRRCLRIFIIPLVLQAIYFADQFKATRVTDGDTIKVSGTQAIIDNDTAASLNEAIQSIDELREMVIENQFNVALDETCSIDPEFHFLFRYYSHIHKQVAK